MDGYHPFCNIYKRLHYVQKESFVFKKDCLTFNFSKSLKLNNLRINSGLNQLNSNSTPTGQ